MPTKYLLSIVLFIFLDTWCNYNDLTMMMRIMYVRFLVGGKNAVKEAASPSQKSRSNGDGHFPDNLQIFVDHYFFWNTLQLDCPSEIWMLMIL